jgi:hypothetical protein
MASQDLPHSDGLEWAFDRFRRVPIDRAARPNELPSWASTVNMLSAAASRGATDLATTHRWKVEPSVATALGLEVSKATGRFTLSWEDSHHGLGAVLRSVSIACLVDTCKRTQGHTDWIREPRRDHPSRRFIQDVCAALGPDWEYSIPVGSGNVRFFRTPPPTYYDSLDHKIKRT